ncbi:ATP synthase assembly factor FMC1, mitochondrial [Beauveria bassiana]|uniref:ATP synthase assembly factor FMC1, mitochondrial n=1 Tax=Beauveria bassiana TaxID=176275 RepID=A0A2N6NDD0_BEABA|nr:ATP synthase assembly factor FMC1, mitochondrial [Beauveria bassiana]
MTSSPAHLRSLYRAILRELPPRPILAAPRSPLHAQLRSTFSSSSSSGGGGGGDESAAMHSPAVAAELVAYLRAQRTYATLLERYNPGMGMDETERVRLTARRVGMDLPVLVKGRL